MCPFSPAGDAVCACVHDCLFATHVCGGVWQLRFLFDALWQDGRVCASVGLLCITLATLCAHTRVWLQCSPAYPATTSVALAGGRAIGWSTVRLDARQSDWQPHLIHKPFILQAG